MTTDVFEKIGEWLQSYGWLALLAVIAVAAVWFFVASAKRKKAGRLPEVEESESTPVSEPTSETHSLADASQDPEISEELASVAVEETTVDLSAEPTSEEENPELLVSEGTLTEPAPEKLASRFSRLKSRLASSGSPFGRKLFNLLSKDHLTEGDWEELEDTLLLADVGAGPTDELIEALRTRVRVEDIKEPSAVKQLLSEELLKLVDPTLDRTMPLPKPNPETPAVLLVVGVNGTGKTTTIGKLARVLVAEGKTVLLGAADTFRAAAADQLETWGNRVGIETVRAAVDGADPASVAFEAVKRGKELGVDVVVVDTAGRLQNKAGLMDELGKITRVIGKEAPLTEVLLVLDATTGQNGMNQARVFGEVAGVTGIVLSKLDGTAKGGIVIAVQRELSVPVKFVGLGEGPDDLAPFSAEEFVEAIVS